MSDSLRKIVDVLWGDEHSCHVSCLSSEIEF